MFSLASRLRRAAAALAACALLLGVSCASEGEEKTYLQGQDLQVAETSGTFDKNAILDVPTFTDTLALDATQIQQFFFKSPYKRPSFLATYQSNGVRAADAIARASIRYGINPILLLVKTQAAQGLIGEQFYPAPASRVEYVFGCGCFAPGKCDPALAGFDVQVDCLARSLRQSLDDVTTEGATAGGWGPNADSTTLDGDRVRPRDASTAALYQHNPRVAVGTGGNWLVWNVFQNYAVFLDYAGPIGGGGVTGWIGEPCKKDANCGYQGGVCADNYPGGFCTAACSKDCPSAPGAVQTFCASFQQAGYCLPVCNPSIAASCRDGYACRKVQKFGSATESQFVCVVK